MAKVFKQKDLILKERKSPVEEFIWHSTTNLSEVANSKNLCFDVRVLDPGKYSYPYHFHRNAEELFVILSGNATLRTPDGFQELSESDIVFFESGSSGAHQIYNHTEFPCKYLDIRTFSGMDVCEYPDSGKVNILPEHELYQIADRVDYYKGEDKISEKWPLEIRERNTKRDG